MPNVDLTTFHAYQAEVYRKLRRYTAVRDCTDDAVLAALARSELPRHVRYWLPQLQRHAPDHRGHCRRCSHWWRPVPMPCTEWRWFWGFLTVEPARVVVPPDPETRSTTGDPEPGS